MATKFSGGRPPAHAAVPPMLDPSTLPEIYACEARGTCMEPELSDGCLLTFETSGEPQVGDLVGIWRKPCAVPAGQPQMLLKRLVSIAEPGPSGDPEPRIVVEMNNPPRRLVFRRSEVIAVHRCLGPAEWRPGGWAAYHPARIAPTRPAEPEHALPSFDRVPPWAKVHAARGWSALPLVRDGEVVVVDPEDVEPVDGGLFVIEYEAQTLPEHLFTYRIRPRRTESIVQIGRTVRMVDAREEVTWWCHPLARPRTDAEAHRHRRSGVILCSDGPYADPLYIAEKLVGRIVGIYRPRGR